MLEQMAVCQRPLLMGVVNVTPDSFSDGGRFLDPAAALAHAARMVAEGADILDIGAESTRPGAASLPLAEEWARLAPVIEACAGLGVPLSVDTYKPEVMRRAVAAGATMINDIWAFRQPGAVEAAAACAGRGAVLAIMHMQGEPGDMQRAPAYADVVGEVAAFLTGRVAVLEAAGVPRAQLVVDPGFGFGKTVDHNLSLLRHLDRLGASGLPVLAGLSRKSTIGTLTGRRDPADRVYGSVAAALIAAQNGATILRVHDVAATRDALRIWQAVRVAS